MTADTNRAEPMKKIMDLADEYARASYYDSNHGTRTAKSKRAELLAELEASRLPLAGAATSVVKMIEEYGLERVYEAARQMLYGLPSPAPSDAAVQPVAWMHDGESRLDICHASIKKLLIDARCGKQVEHYTVPLYEHPAGLPTAPAGAREAMEKALDVLGDGARYVGHAEGVAVCEQLRAALAAAPLERKPLSDEEIRRIYWTPAIAGSEFADGAEKAIALVRAIEAEHGTTLAKEK